MDRAHRQELKHDKFVEQVGHTVDFAAQHTEQVKKYGIIALAVLVLVAGLYWYMRNAAAQRDEDLSAAIRIQEASVGGPAPNDFVLSYTTQEEKDKAVTKAFSDLAAKYPGKREGVIAQYYLGVTYADRGNTAEAEKNLKAAADSGVKDYASQAKLSLAQLYGSTNRVAEGEKLLQSMIDSPTIMVSKEQATIALAKLIAPTKPAEARKLLEPLRSERGAVSRAAITALSELPAR